MERALGHVSINNELGELLVSEARKPFGIESRPKTTMAWGVVLLLITILFIFLNVPLGFLVFFGILGFCCLFSYSTVISPAQAEISQQCRFLRRWPVFTKIESILCHSVGLHFKRIR